MRQLLSILAGFLPWIVFGVLSGPSLWRLDTAVIVALALVVATGYKQLTQGFILTWGSLLFFGVILIMAVFLRNQWIIRNLDILAKGTLAAIAWGSILVGEPFVLQYARQTAPPDRQASPVFFQTCRTLAMMWGTIFLAATGLSLVQSFGWRAGGMGYQLASWGLIGVGLWLNHWYPEHVRRRAKTAVDQDKMG